MRTSTRCLPTRPALTILTACLLRFATAHAAKDDAQTWVETHAIPFGATEFQTDHSDLDFFRDLIGDAQVVGMGEQTHGTHEFFTMRHRLLEYMVSELGFTLFAVESGWGPAMTANRYVVHGEGLRGSAASALQNFFPGSREFDQLLRWMRGWNSDPAHPTVQLVGLDLFYPGEGLKWAVKTVEPAGHTFGVSTGSLLDRLARAFQRIHYASGASTYYDICHEIAGLLLEERPVYEDLLTEADLGLVDHARRVLEMKVNYPTESPHPAGIIYRDKHMAENPLWWLDHEGEVARMAIWAHNGHIARNWEEWEWRPLGFHLAEALGNDYVAIGFSTCKGTLFAGDAEGTQRTTWDVPEYPSESSAAALCHADIPNYVLDLRTLDPETPGGQFFSSSRPFMVIGSHHGTTEEALSSAWQDQQLLEMFDLLIHIQETSATQYR